MKALDKNGDGELDAAEIANAPAALKTLDKNGDGKLTRDEIMPKFPGGFGGPPQE
jgi:Ca2+-binding EF-hand superfamily protein